MPPAAPEPPAIPSGTPSHGIAAPLPPLPFEGHTDSIQDSIQDILAVEAALVLPIHQFIVFLPYLTFYSAEAKAANSQLFLAPAEETWGAGTGSYQRSSDRTARSPNIADTAENFS